MDDAALGALAAQRIDWRYKGFPSRFDGLTVGELVEAKPPLAQFGTPLLVLDGPALDHNLTLMAQYCAKHGVDLAPHGKTTMAPQLFARQLDAGCWGITAATIAHLRAYRAFGVETVVLANQLVDPDSLRWVAGELRRSPRFRLLCFADSVAGIELMQSALAEADAARPVEVVIDLGAPGGRTGCRTLDEAQAVARAVRAADRLRLAGAGGFEGALAPDRAPRSVEHIRDYLRSLRQLVAPFDLGLPEPHTVERADGTTERLTGCTIVALADQHAFLRQGDDAQLRVGEVVTCGISHPCTAFDKWQLIPVVEDGHVVDVVRTFF